jgi:tetratricopeptide (TPR) repeat protein
MSAGRNDPCPCGSGRKYKHCCLAREAAAAKGGGDLHALNHAAMAHQRMGRLDEAASGYRRAIALAPGNAELHFNLGTALQARGSAAEAVEANRRALAIDPRHAVAHHNHANAHR